MSLFFRASKKVQTFIGAYSNFPLFLEYRLVVKRKIWILLGAQIPLGGNLRRLQDLYKGLKPRSALHKPDRLVLCYNYAIVDRPYQNKIDFKPYFPLIEWTLKGFITSKRLYVVEEDVYPYYRAEEYLIYALQRVDPELLRLHLKYVDVNLLEFQGLFVLSFMIRWLHRSAKDSEVEKLSQEFPLIDILIEEGFEARGEEHYGLVAEIESLLKTRVPLEDFYKETLEKLYEVTKTKEGR